MDRQMMLDKLAEHGVDVSAITEETPDAVLAEMLRCLDAKEEGHEESPMEMDEEHWKPVPEDEEGKHQMREMAKKYGERFRKFAARCGYNEDEEGGEKVDLMTAKAKKPEDEEAPMKMSEAQIRKLVGQAVAEAMKGSAKGDLSELQKFAEETKAAQRKQAVDGLIDGWSKAGKLPPAVKEDVRLQLMEADARTVVAKFSEKGKAVELTAFDRIRRTWDRMPSLFGERLPSGGGTSADDERDKIKDHFEAFSEQFSRSGMTQEKLLKAFDSKRAKNPRLTAEQFLAS